MLLRIFLIVSILAGAGIGAINHFMVKPHVEGIISERNKQEKRAQTAEDSLAKTNKVLASTQNQLKSTKATLSETEQQLTSTRRKLTDESAKLAETKTDLESTKKDLNDTRIELGAWKNFGLTVDQVKDVIADGKRLKVANDVLEEEKLVLQKIIDKQARQLSSLLTNQELEAPLPAGLKGNVLVVDPKWDFVVLDVGEKQNVVQNGVLMVSRNGKLIAKIKVVSVQPERCIANIMPQWRLGDVMEGDLALSKN
jgi:vacuolar-type H+-ATPase subunit I/STV1